MATFVLIHGTFAKSARWPVLEASLAETAGEAGEDAQFEQLAWTGKNRASARRDAASAIHNLIGKIRLAATSGKIFLIGHSHGGSAIAYFVKQHPELAKTLSGCAFLSTPFVAIRPKRHPLRVVSILAAFPLILAVSLWIHFFPFHSLDMSALPLLLGSGVAGVLYGLVTMIGRENSGNNTKLEDTVRQQTADLPLGNYLFLRCAGDEAAAGLSAAQFIAWLGMRVSRVLDRVARPIFSSSRLIREVAQGFYFWRVPALLILAIWTVLPTLVENGVGGELRLVGNMISSGEFLVASGFVFLLLACGVIPALFFLCLLGAFLVFLTQALVSRAFGWTRLSTGFLVELAIEPLPFGSHSLVHIDWDASSVGLDGIVHSWTYAHPVAIRHLQTWVKASMSKCQ